MIATRKIRVLVVDDSASVRQTLKNILESDSAIEVIATAPDPYVAVSRITETVPDVITLDIEMPRMDGITFLKKIMAQHPMPVVICSSLTEAGSEIAMTALEEGAVEVICKPRIGTKRFLEETAVAICDAVKSAAQAKLKGKRFRTAAPSAFQRVPPPTVSHQKEQQEKLDADAMIPKPRPGMAVEKTDPIIAIGASTGGTDAIRDFLLGMPASAPGIVMVQHMPEHFTLSFAQRLNALCKIRVKEAVDGDMVESGLALLAPGNFHMMLKRTRGRYFVEVREGPLVCRHRPSVDVLFRSVARYAGSNAVGVLMTGMGDDGARGMKEMYDMGAYTLAQDEASCVVFGMPHEAIKLGGVNEVLPLSRLSEAALRQTSAHR